MKYRKNGVIALTAILLLIVTQLAAEQDAYHDWLQNQLEMEYNITDGFWMLSDNETETTAKLYTQNGVDRTDLVITDMPFSQAVNLKTEDRPENFWNYSATYATQDIIQSGDVLLAVFWIRGVSAERGSGFIHASYDLGAPPYTGMFMKEFGLSNDWQQWFVPYQATEELNQSWLSLKMGYMAQEVQIGGVAVINFGNTYGVDQLPASTYDLDYEGRAPDAAWRSAATSRIESHRMQDLEINVVDADGNTVQNADVQVRMHQHVFGFGSAVALYHWKNHSQKEMYQEKILDLTSDGRSLNMAVFENAMKWQLWENDGFPGTREETAALTELLLENDFRVRGHNLMWPGFQWLPDDLEVNQDDPDYVRSRLTTHIDEIMNFPGIQNNMDEWDVINEPIHLTDIVEVFGNTDIYADIFMQAAENNPEAKLYINDYDILTRLGANLSAGEQYMSIIDDIESKGGRIDGIGMQGHFKYPLTPPEIIYEILDEYASDGKSISITEYDAVGVDEFMAGEYMRDFLTIVFSHPAVDNFLMWGIWDAIHWRDDSPMFRDDWSLKPSGQAFIDLVFDEWWTDESGETDMDGRYVTRAFLGTHIVIVEHNGTSTTDTILLEGEKTVFNLTLDRPTSTSEHESTYATLGQNQPNPANGITTFAFSVKEAGHARLILYNAVGIPIQTLIDNRLSAGIHKYELNVEALPSGTYVYRLETEKDQHYRVLVVTK